jgi:hypothetical protein
MKGKSRTEKRKIIITLTYKDPLIQGSIPVLADMTYKGEKDQVKEEAKKNKSRHGQKDFCGPLKKFL